jgi:hypothetical protein
VSMASRTIQAFVQIEMPDRFFPVGWSTSYVLGSSSMSASRLANSIITKANGGQILNGPMEVPGGAWVVERDGPAGRGVRSSREEGAMARRRIPDDCLASDRRRGEAVSFRTVCGWISVMDAPDA